LLGFRVVRRVATGRLGADLSGLCGDGFADRVRRVHEGEPRRRANRALIDPRDDVPLDFVEVGHAASPWANRSGLWSFAAGAGA